MFDASRASGYDGRQDRRVHPRILRADNSSEPTAATSVNRAPFYY